MEFRIVFMDCQPMVADIITDTYRLVSSWEDDDAMTVLHETLAWKQLAEHFDDDTPIVIAEPNKEPVNYRAESSELRQHEANNSPILLYKNRYLVAFSESANHATILDTTTEAEHLANIVNKRSVPDDLITQAEAAKLAGITTQGVHQAIRDGRLRGYNNPNAEYKRQGKVLVSKSAICKLWRIEKNGEKTD